MITGTAEVVAPAEKISRERVVLPELQLRRTGQRYERLIEMTHGLAPLRTAVVHPVEAILPSKLRGRLRRDIKRGTVACIDALARSRQSIVDDALLAHCRVAAECQMPHALAHEDLLRRIMASVAGSLDGLAAARQDLWRLAHLAIHLTAGMAVLRESTASLHARSAEALASRLRRRLRKALIAYARTVLRAKASRASLIVKAREAALAEIGPRGAAEAERLANSDVGAGPAIRLLRQGVARPLRDLALDWQRQGPISSRPGGSHR